MSHDFLNRNVQEMYEGLEDAQSERHFTGAMTLIAQKYRQVAAEGDLDIISRDGQQYYVTEGVIVGKRPHFSGYEVDRAEIFRKVDSEPEQFWNLAKDGHYYPVLGVTMDGLGVWIGNANNIPMELELEDPNTLTTAELDPSLIAPGYEEYYKSMITTVAVDEEGNIYEP